MNGRTKLFLGFIVLFLLWLLTRNIFDYQKNWKFYQSLQQEYTTVKQENTKLKTGLLLASESGSLEETIRNRLNLAKDGEYVVILPTPTISQFSPTPTPAPIYEQWLHTYFR